MNKSSPALTVWFLTSKTHKCWTVFAVALATSAATCQIDPGLNDRFLDNMINCVLTFQYAVWKLEAQGNDLDPKKTCEYKSKLDSCVKSGMKDECGPEMATLMEKMWALWSVYEYAEYNCGVGMDKVVSRRVSDAAVPFTMRSGWARFQN
ncbi:hypothetical protein ElyMa_002265700 [Elysia marginata]|uniref:Uncharacterized protein n=1 Tax=Elysia marginata TaxID=1093978 RepID=A0AAV4FYQ0_9GAST|nr:hypothetical protein ElyMa_002265700 [Elysia marginata]